MNLVNQNLRQIAGPLLRLLTLFDEQTRAVSAAADADIRFPGTSTAGEKRSHGYRAAGPCSHAALFAEPA